MRGKLICILMIFLSNYTLQSQGSAGDKALYESRYIVDMPNAGILDKGTFDIYSCAFARGGILLEFDAGLFSNFNMGLSFSGGNIIGSGDVNWQNLPGIHLRFRFLNETANIPAFILGVNTQGRGEFNWKDKRFITMSPGLFLAASKNYRWILGTVALHSGFNYNFENIPEKRLPNIYLGLEHSIGSSLSLNFEYNTTIDDKNGDYMKRKGLANAALRWSLAKGITLEFQARDLFENIKGFNGFNRVICLEYINSF